jgi:hypothetical protein
VKELVCVTGKSLSQYLERAGLNNWKELVSISGKNWPE